MSLLTNDLIIRIKNGYMAKRDNIEARWSKINEGVVELLKISGFIKSYEVIDENGKKRLNIGLLYIDNDPAVREVKLLSKPGRRIYRKHKEIKSVLGGLGVAILSTPKGLMTDTQAKDAQVGGEALFEIW
ncbi:30S ribosomal protein S8 [Candidatus Roizmanbacteria bacterium RIFCSPHIGHO2_01_FULL_39_12b]|uniref:Small ribosomal subunit protein uS8 n=1 Tax=Candidatus Roizmanbacteria bacterium RIFCSPHIGHO2_01_FULL_39_12b TaxID=1802030 RepID=A0A1F7GC38_9BACT|nr:MAG: 30S ribosomal protein S8 [Candidatus Roizmanbacteria bacterium RIFCSPHIGHO2_01_FULL_39_12b]OGK47093.1 MAG: 30S ribosomal protein S8 [Candidatus Roizmanbacteria bacterium RIFCSPLOWO2_01_FULL_39_19]